MVGVDVEQARAEVRRAAGAPPGAGAAAAAPPAAGRARAAPAPRGRRCPTCATRGSRSSARPSSWSSSSPTAVGRTAADVGANDFTHPTYRAVWELVEQAGGPARGRRRLGGAAARAAPPTRRRRGDRGPGASSRC